MNDKSDGCRDVRNLFKDVETLKREELNRRRLLRYEQVRQQSKELANLVRQKVSTEREKQIGLVQERVEARTQQWKVRKLKALQTEYKSTIRSIGKSHADAACLPDEDMLRKIESNKTLVAAQQRGHDALNRLREEEAARRRTDDERRQHILNTRAVEEARSAAVVSLPKPESTVGIKSILTKASASVAPPAPSGAVGRIVSRNTIPEWPKRSWPSQSLPLGIIPPECQNEKGDSMQGPSDASCKQPTYIPVSSHGDSIDIEVPRNLPNHSQNSSFNPKPAIFIAPASHSDVKLYDYTSCYQSQYDKIFTSVKKVQESKELNANEAAEREICAEKFDKSSSLEREQLRSRDAFHRIQVQRDYKDIMGSLSLLAKKNATVCSYRDISPKSWSQSTSQEEKLSHAVENLLQAANVSSSESVQETSLNSPNESLVFSELEDTPCSVPKLNVGRWPNPNLSIEHVQLSKDNSSSTNSIVVKPPLESHNATIASRQENLERNTALRNLVQQINNERHSLISNHQPIDSSQINQSKTYTDSNDLDVKILEKKVLLQRQQLRKQRFEVKHLGESIVVPECMKQPIVHPVVPSISSSTTTTHESIIIEESHSDDVPSSSSLFSPEVLNHKVKKSKSKKNKSVEQYLDSGPTKDNMKYSFDVSLSSVVMDQTENSSSGSKSLSLHGVQVLVKLCGADKDSSECSPAIISSEDNRSLTVVDLSGEGDTHDGIEKGEDHSISKNIKEVKHTTKKKVKKKKEALNKKVLKSPKSASLKVSQKDKDRLQILKQTTVLTETVPIEGKVEAGEKMNYDKQDDKAFQAAYEQLKAETVKHEQPESTSTSYLSPPDRVISSLTEDIKALIALAQSNIELESKTHGGINRTPNIQKKTLGQYINRLLAMSRESIEKLNVSCSDISTPTSTIFHSSNPENELTLNLTDIGFTKPTEEDPSKSIRDQAIDIPNRSDNFSPDNNVVPYQIELDQSPLLFESNDNVALTDMTEQCHEKISALTRMIEEVRRETVVSSGSHSYSESERSFIHNHSRSPMHFDSTTYMSPPSQVLEWAEIAVPSNCEETSGISLDPYGSAVMQLLADVRAEIIQKAADASSLQNNQEQHEILESSQNRAKPPVAFWKNIERCNVSSPTEPHELSTIPELGTTVPESVDSLEPELVSTGHALSRASTPGTPPDVIAELMRRKLLTSPFVWAKKKDKPNPNSISNSSSKNSLDSDLSSMKSGAEQSDISASKETNTLSVESHDSGSNGSRNWKTNILMSPVDMSSSADEVEGDFRKMGIGWVGAMLRKTKEAGALSSTSGSDGSPVKVDNSDFKALSKLIDDEPILSSPLVATITQGRRHSTPVKDLSDHSSSCGSHLV